MFQRETGLDEQRLKDIALSQARALFNQVVDLRDWNARHGGVYVPVTPETQPNPWLKVANRDETTLSGRQLTLMNPAYMTRQLAEIDPRAPRHRAAPDEPPPPAAGERAGPLGGGGARGLRARRNRAG